MPTDKRQRQKQLRQERLEAERHAARRAASRRRLVTGIVIGAFVFAVLAAIAFFSGGDGDEEATTTTTAAVTTTVTSAPPADQPEVTVPPDPLPTELQITDLTTGDGPEAVAGSRVTVDYVGIAASSGEEFDSSYGGEPRSFTLAAGSVIEGWVEGIPGMKVGGRRQLVIPPDLAYGPGGNPPGIGPDETLVFIVDLVGVA